MIHFPSNITWPEIERAFTLPPEYPRLTLREPDGFELLTQLLPTALEDDHDLAFALAIRVCQLEDLLESWDLISRSELSQEFARNCHGDCDLCIERDYESGECGLIHYAPRYRKNVTNETD